ncbi:predicted protein [Lichtheimia corymbifera JMRC:FSU:9682]|uniref:Uncharacterized protein n=1 Tax=Lichtheimia corymbifera JMRC:FSU:9682 TaxID=1263082 RepID=A0A068RYU9_9FUNG|nr:predicted protein [Lichtheimia corymbifera JMRC:FSU:9682]
MVRYYYQDDPLPQSHSAIIRWFGFDHFVPEKAVTSYWMPSKALLCIRVITCLYSTVVIWASIGTSAIQGNFQHYFAHFTEMTYIGLHAYLVTVLYHHVRYLMHHHEPRSFFNQPSVLNYMFYYLYHTICVYNIITPIVYWAALSPQVTHASGTNPSAAQSGGYQPPIDWWINTSMHGVSFVLMATEVLFSRMRMTLRMVVIILINIILYMLLTFIIFASTGWWVYSFLDWSQGAICAAWYLGIGAAFVVVFGVMYLIHMLRDWTAKKLAQQ